MTHAKPTYETLESRVRMAKQVADVVAQRDTEDPPMDPRELQVMLTAVSLILEGRILVDTKGHYHILDG